MHKCLRVRQVSCVRRLAAAAAPGRRRRTCSSAGTNVSAARPRTRPVRAASNWRRVQLPLDHVAPDRGQFLACVSVSVFRKRAAPLFLLDGTRFRWLRSVRLFWARNEGRARWGLVKPSEIAGVAYLLLFISPPAPIFTWSRKCGRMLAPAMLTEHFWFSTGQNNKEFHVCVP